MSTRGQFNTKSPTVRRIMKEAAELASSTSPDYHAEPLESNLFEWHFTIRGPPSPSPYAQGLYHGRIALPPTYPLRPPAFRFLTPSGRFEANREICLSISGHHEETWQPAWGIRTALVAIRSFMDTDAAGQLGGLECTEAARKRFAGESRAWKCPSCGKSNEEIMKAKEEAAKEAEANGSSEEEAVPEELRLAYREDLAKKEEGGSSKSSTGVSTPTSSQDKTSPIETSTKSPETAPSSTGEPRSTTSQPVPTRTAPQAFTPAPLQQRVAPRPAAVNNGIPSWVDKAIYGIIAALAFMIIRRIF
ncbi:UBC-like protein [Aulographum hederae CBS 113979]|uniref:UBC-like protein n=1 Tax=Aulographum hederae CBS 113979 TaxID=1176131 RepID=A0A6G1H0R9_9PEZI|nr:UBC-like protein [Aulographum hederae CBS 113979]